MDSIFCCEIWLSSFRSQQKDKILWVEMDCLSKNEFFFTHPDAVPNLYDWLSFVETQMHGSQWGQIFFWTPVTFIVWTETVATVFIISSFYVPVEKVSYTGLKNTRLYKWWLKFHFSVNHFFNHFTLALYMYIYFVFSLGIFCCFYKPKYKSK